MPTFNQFAGQEVASGIRANEPVVAFETEGTRTVLNNLGLIDGLIPKIGKVLFRETRIFDSPLDRIFRKTALPFGVGFEDAEFVAGGKNKKNDGTCVPIGNPTMEAQINLINLAWSIDVRLVHRQFRRNRNLRHLQPYNQGLRRCRRGSRIRPRTSGAGNSGIIRTVL